MELDRRGMIAMGSLALASPSFAAASNPRFPGGFLWGAATAGHQVEGNDTASDTWFVEHLKPSVFAEPAGDAVNSFELWTQDLELVKSLGLNAYRFSVEWSRIEPEPGAISIAMLDHYRRMIEGCRSRGLTPIVTYSHFTEPRWFAAAGGWTNPQAPGLFARHCATVTRHMGSGIGRALTMNEPNLLRLLQTMNLPPPLIAAQNAQLAAAAKTLRTTKFVLANMADPADLDTMQRTMLAGHRVARAAIKSVRPDLPVGVSLAMFDDQAVGAPAARDAARTILYGAWLDAAKDDDFIGVQNYERVLWGAQGRLPPPPGATLNWNGSEVFAPSLAGAVRYAHQATGRPVLVTEHGVGTDDDRLRAALIPAALHHLKQAMDDGVPVEGYVHWALLDNFEWVFGYKPKYGLVAVDRQTFARSPKPSANVLGAIARRNAL